VAHTITVADGVVADVIGFRSTCSAVIEVKVSRSDFMADAKKPERRKYGAGLGVYRFYLCPEGIIGPEEVPARWGLLHAIERAVKEVVAPTGNMWPPIGAAVDGWANFQHAANPDTERAVLFSIARRLAAGQPI
jgi:hypothetical protein